MGANTWVPPPDFQFLGEAEGGMAALLQPPGSESGADLCTKFFPFGLLIVLMSPIFEVRKYTNVRCSSTIDTGICSFHIIR